MSQQKGFKKHSNKRIQGRNRKIRGVNLAQLNVAKMIAPLESPSMADFVARLETVNARADSAPGFIWRLRDEGAGATSIRIFADDLLLVNMSVWENPEVLNNFVYKQGDHSEALRKRREWFESPTEAMVVCWMIDEGHHPSLEEARNKLTLLREIGSSKEAFSLKTASEFFRE